LNELVANAAGDLTMAADQNKFFAILRFVRDFYYTLYVVLFKAYAWQNRTPVANAWAVSFLSVLQVFLLLSLQGFFRIASGYFLSEDRLVIAAPVLVLVSMRVNYSILCEGPDLTGSFCAKRIDRNWLGKELGHAEEETDAGADSDAAAAD
jgi:hypothetical protein